MDPIQLSSLGRDVRVGDFYNYFNDTIVTRRVEVPPSSVEIQIEPTPTIECFFRKQQSDRFKLSLLGIHSHLHQSIENKSLDLNKLWFADYLKASSTESADSDAIQITVFLRAVQRTETLDQQFIFSRSHEYQLKSGGVATHLVEKVVYGGEFICLLRKPFYGQRETKEAAEESIYRAAKNYFTQAIKVNFDYHAKPPSELDGVTYTVFNSLKGTKYTMEAARLLVIRFKFAFDFSKASQTKKLRPMEIFLRYIPAQIEALILSEKACDARLQIEQHQKYISKESSRLSKHCSLIRIPPLEKVICQFRDLLPPLWGEIDKFYSSCDQEKNMNFVVDTTGLLLAMVDWLKKRRQEIEMLHSLLDGTRFNLLTLPEIDSRMQVNNGKSVKVFVLKLDYNRDPLMEHIYKMFGTTGPEPSLIPLPIFHVVSAGMEHLATVRDLLHAFSDEADYSEDLCSHQIGLVPLCSPLNDGDIKTSLSPTEQKAPQQKPAQSVSSLNLMLFPCSNAPSVSAATRYNHRVNESLASPAEIAQKLLEDNIPKTITKVDAIRKNPNESSPALCNSLEGAEMQHQTRASRLLKRFKEPSVVSAVPVSDPTRYKPGFNQSFTSPSAEIDAQMLEDILPETNENTKVMNPIKENPTVSSSESCNSAIDAEIQQKTRASTSTKTVEKTNVVSVVPVLSETKINQLKPCRGDGTQGERTAFPPVSERINTYHLKLEGTTQTNYSMKSLESSKISTKTSLPDRCDETSAQSSEQEKNVQTDQEQFLPPIHQRVGERFADEINGYSQLTKQSQPNIYYLKAKEVFAGDDLRWFDIGRPNNSQDHKIIILMGATGCGKSTLINGMINYILDVQWSDPFRFECIREDKKTGVRNQAHSQTSSVTAYTLYHCEGMAVPYSVTIIDTPGYGDTRGIARDKEITNTIHRFLTQRQKPIDKIHAACFVAASGDSRLTATQRYILDSVLSVFGKDVKGSIRLLVTFADNADPPVVEACKAAQFPVQSAGIAYSKFNSSVLYAANEQKDDDFCFDQLFWDMGQENFEKFFTMLQGMNGRDLASTRIVIKCRDDLEQSLKAIDRELEDCLVTIENKEKMMREWKECCHKIESNKNFVIEEKDKISKK